ncbi:MAG: RNA 2'-phosphotransferase [Pseudonocardia sp.]|nr:RNA 2'-phosphotransferase [Pseudonocardia sp.]MBO0872615.1 RNA 2'-phosphotransferase [Pseudonocardia sp.]
MVRISKYLARHLRHRPDRIGLTLDEHGWARVDELLSAAARNGFAFTRNELEQVVAGNDKVIMGSVPCRWASRTRMFHRRPTSRGAHSGSPRSVCVTHNPRTSIYS